MEPDPVKKTITMGKMARYSGAGNIHSDEETARERGLGGALAQGGQLVGYLNEMMLKALGPGFLSGGEISVTFIRPVRPGDEVTARATQKAAASENGRKRVEFEIWLENQNGEKCVVGTAAGFAPP